MIQLDSDSLGYASVLDDRYLIIDTIGQGRYAKVKLAVDVTDKQKYAIKVMKAQQSQSSLRSSSFVNEVSIQADLTHKNIVRITHCNLAGKYRKFDGRVSIVSYFVMKLADYGELYEIIEQSSPFSENLARALFQQLIAGTFTAFHYPRTGLEYMHERGVVHRDIKSENIVISKSGVLKLADFGFSCKAFDDKGVRVNFNTDNFVGSPEYNPPELSNVSKDKKFYSPEAADLFSSAVVLFHLVMKSAPFQSTKQSDQHYKLFKTNKQDYWKVFPEISQPTAAFRDLIEKMLDEHPQKRLTIDQIKKHHWFSAPIPPRQIYLSEVKAKFESFFNSKKTLTMQKSNLKFANRRQLSQAKVLKKNNVDALKPLHPENPEVLEAINAKLQVRSKQIDNQKNSSQKQSQAQKINVMEEKKEDSSFLKKKKPNSSPATPPDSDQ